MEEVVSKPTVSVVIPVHNGGASFRRCLESLGACLPFPEEVIVVADGDTDGSRQVAEEFGTIVLKTPTPLGPARARNLGAQIAQGDLLFFFDADVIIPPDALRQIVVAFQHDPNLTAVFGSYDDMPFESNFLSQYKNLLHHYVHQTANEEASTFWTGCGAIRREIFFKIGSFNEKYHRPSVEDIDLGYRLRGAGYRIRLLKDLKVKHLKRWEVVSLLKADFFCRALPWTDLILKEGHFINDLNVKLSGRISVVMTYLLLLALLSTLWIPWLLVATIFLAIGLFTLNWDLYCFFTEKRGLVFSVKTVFWHWMYFFYSGLAFFIGLVKHSLRRFSPGGKSRRIAEGATDKPNTNAT